MTMTLFTTMLMQPSAEHAAMTAGGWVFMIAAWIFILTLTFYTFSKILGGNKK